MIEKLEHPYWVIKTELPSHDFNKEIVRPGVNEKFPDGAIGMRVDDNFWAVAAIPYKYGYMSIQEIVKELWPDLYDDAEFGEDYEGP